MTVVQNIQSHLYGKMIYEKAELDTRNAIAKMLAGPRRQHMSCNDFLFFNSHFVMGSAVIRFYDDQNNACSYCNVHKNYEMQPIQGLGCDELQEQNACIYYCRVID